MWRRLRVIGINLIVFALLAEAVALALYYFDTGWPFYLYRKPYPVIEESARGDLTADVLHPYFGPIHRTGIRPETNNVGFGSPQAFPFARTGDRQFLIGVFGGSVARIFCDRGQARLVERLRRSRTLDGRDIVLLCFAHEGYKQPQQLLVLAYFLSLGQQLDLAVNIDGFNEVALGTQNHERGRDISMPSPIHLDPLIGLIDRSTMTTPMIESLAAINRYKQRLNELVARIERNRIASVNFVLERLYARTTDQYRAELARFAALPPVPPSSSLIQVTPPVAGRDAATLYEEIASGWSGASLLMNDMLRARGIPYLHVLQPNQYHTRRRFGDEEARVALNSATPFKQAVERGYPALVRESASLRGKEQFFDATAIFDDEAGAVYEDDCCHYTQRGNDLLADFIATSALETIAVGRVLLDPPSP